MATNDDFMNDALKRMVDSQLRPNKVTDPRILDAMRRLRRDQFLPASLRAQACSDQNVPLAPGRVLAQPMVLARLVQAAEPVAGETALVVGAGTGYAAALLAALGCQVTALEEAGALADLAKTALAAQAPSVTLVTGPLTGFWPAGAPYDLILIDGAVTEVPAAVAAQLKSGTGRLMAILGGGPSARAVLGTATPGGVSVRAIFDCICPVLPAFAPAPAFAF